jgi:hypothetical protein
MIPAICDSCGVTWGAEGVIAGSGATNIQITGSKVGPCPRCGGMGSIPDGIYDLQDDTLKVIQAAATTSEDLQDLITLLESLREGEASSAEVIETVAREVPDLAPVVRKGLAKSDPTKLIALLIAIVTLYLQASTPAPPSADEVADAIREQPLPTYTAPSARNDRKANARRKSSPKTHGKSKQRKSRKRR